MPPRGDTSRRPDARGDERLLSLIPRNPRQIYDPKLMIRLVVDRDSFFEIAPLYGRSRVTGLARLNGYPVGVMANNPKHHGGATDVAAGNKVMRLIQLCNTFHLPLISFADEPGFMVGLESEKTGIERAGARLVAMTNSELDAVGNGRGRAALRRRRPMPPPAERHVPPLRVAVGELGLDAHRRRRERRLPARNRQRARSRRNARRKSKRGCAPSRRRSAPPESTGQDIIDPRDTRALLCEFVEDAQRILRSQLGAPRIPYLP